MVEAEEEVEVVAEHLSEEEEAVASETEAAVEDLEVAEEAVDLIVPIQVEVEEEGEEDGRLKINILMLENNILCTIMINIVNDKKD